MKRLVSIVSLLIAGVLAFASCGVPAANNAAGNANKPANAANAAAAPAADKAAVEADVRKVIADFETALNKNDAAAVEKFYTDDYSLIDQNGEPQTKASRMEQIKSGKIKWEGLKFSDVKVRTHPAGDGAVVTAHATGKTIYDGKSEDRNSMVTWVMGKSKDKGWQFLNAQITDIKGGAAAKADDKKTDDTKSEDKKAASETNK